MGYHGFGMRKEVYKRKPKQAFEKIKKHNKKNPYAAPKTRDDREVYIHTYHKPAYKRWWFILLALGVIGYFGYIIIFENLLPEYRLKKEIEAFENQGLLKLYQDNLVEINEVFNLMEESTDSWTGLGKHFGYDQRIIKVQSRHQLPNQYRQSIGVLKNNKERYIVNNDLLIYNRKKPEVRAETWKLNIYAETIGAIPTTYIDHMDIDKEALADVLTKNTKRNWTYESFPTYKKITLRKFQSFYSIYLATSPEKVLEAHPKRIKELAPGVYWD